MLKSIAKINGPVFNARLSSDQSLSSGAFTKVQIDTESFDSNNNFDTTLYRFTPSVAGYYQVIGQINAATATAVTRCFSSIYKNGSSIATGVDNAPFAGGTSSPVSAIVYMNGTTDYLELYAYMTATSPVIYSGDGYTYFGAFYIRPE